MIAARISQNSEIRDLKCLAERVDMSHSVVHIEKSESSDISNTKYLTAGVALLVILQYYA